MSPAALLFLDLIRTALPFLDLNRKMLLEPTSYFRLSILEGKSRNNNRGTGALGRAVSKQFTSFGAELSIPYVFDDEVSMIEKELGSLMSNFSLVKANMFELSEVQNFVKMTASLASKCASFDPEADRIYCNQPAEGFLQFP